jgi:dienelactone hydrolase
MEKYSLYTEKENIGDEYRNEYLSGVLSFINKQKAKADKEREKYFTPDFSSIDNYEKSIEVYRSDLIKMLGFPLNEYNKSEEVSTKMIFVAEDTLSKIYRITIEIDDGLYLYGVLFTKGENAKLPVIIAQHGGYGTPEICAGFYGSFNYNDMIRRLLMYNVNVFAPQLLLYSSGKNGDQYNRAVIDTSLRQLGGSIAGLEVYALRKVIDWLYSSDFVDNKRIGMVGLSYGGFYTMMTAAVDTRIKASYISGFFNDRFKYNWSDMSFTGQARKLLDAEIAGLIAPRQLFIESGSKDETFEAQWAQQETKKVVQIYEKLGIKERFDFRIFEGDHELARDDTGFKFLINYLNKL